MSQIRQIVSEGESDAEGAYKFMALRREMLQKTYLPVIGVYVFLLSVFSFAVGRLKPKIENNKHALDYESTFS